MARITIPTLVLALHTLPCGAQAPQDDGTVFLEVPLLVQAPGLHAVVRAYHDGTRFFVDAGAFLSRLGYTVEQEGMRLSAADVRTRLVLDFVRLQATRAHAEPLSLSGHGHYGDGRFLLAVEALEQLFGSDVHFDRARLSLQLSTAAEHFDTHALGSRAFLGSEVPGPLRFGRERHWLGGAIASWSITRQWRHQRPVYTGHSLHLTTSMLHGSVRGTLGDRPEITYLFDRPGDPLLTQLEVGRMAAYGQKVIGAVRLSNLPLASLPLQRTAVLRGHAPPHALVEARAGGQVVDRTRVDRRGRYRLRVPAYYGSTEAAIRVQPLGGTASYEERHYVLATPSLAPPSRLYYDAVVGPGGMLHARYGVLPRLTMRVAARHRGDVSIGVVASPVLFGVLSADVAWPLRLAQGRHALVAAAVEHRG